MYKILILLFLFMYACSDTTTSSTGEDTSAIPEDEKVYFDGEEVVEDTVFEVDLGEVNDFTANDIAGNSFSLYEKLKSKPVLLLYTDIIAYKENAVAFNGYTKLYPDKYHYLIVDNGNDITAFNAAINATKLTTAVINDTSHAVYKELELYRHPVTLLIDKDKFIVVYIKRNVTTTELFDEMLRGVINEEK